MGNKYVCEYTTYYVDDKGNRVQIPGLNGVLYIKPPLKYRLKLLVLKLFNKGV